MNRTNDRSLESLREGGEAFIQEISREYYLAHSGQKSTAELQPIYARHADVVSEDALALTLDAFRGSTDGTEERRSARTLLDWQAESQSGRELASLDEREIAWESSAVVRVPDGREVKLEAM